MKKLYYLIILTVILGLVLTGCFLSNVGQVPTNEQSGITYSMRGGPTEEVAVDIKPKSCPNPLNVKSKGVLPVAILGTADFDVTEIDPATLMLQGVSPLRWTLEDVATPYAPFIGKEDFMDCNTLGPDGYLDLTLKFDAQEIVAALGSVSDGDVIIIPLTGELLGGTPIEGEDVIIIIKKGN